MHAVAAFFASIITIVSGFFAPTVASNSPVDVRTTQPAAASAAQVEITGNPFTDPAAASAVATASAIEPEPVPASPPQQTIINQPVIERIIERIVPQGGTISAATLTAILADFEQSISSRVAAINPPKATIPEQVAAAGNSAGYFFAPASQRIDQLTNTAINTPTITGGTISGASISGYLPLSGGALSGALTGTDLSLSGVLTAGTLSVGALSSSGALIGPYFNATSTTATSTFTGKVAITSIPWGLLSTDGLGNVVASSTPTVASLIATSPTATSTFAGPILTKDPVADVRAFGAKGNGVTDDTAAIQAAMNASRNVFLPPGTYLTSGIIVTQDGTHLYGAGMKASTLKLSGTTGILLTTNNNAVTINDLGFLGNDDTSKQQLGTDFPTINASTTNTTAIQINSQLASSISRVLIHGFGSYGIWASSTAVSARGSTLVVSDTSIYNTYVAVFLPSVSSEYTRWSNLNLTRNKYGVYLSAGNTIISNCKINDNSVGVYLIGETNSGHGSISNSLINHNTIYSIRANSVTIGFSFIGNQIFSSYDAPNGFMGGNI